METQTPQTPVDTAQVVSNFDELVTQCQALTKDWDTRILPIIEDNRDAFELDITVDEARARSIVEGNETYIGRRVIAANMQRELPTYINYLQGSHRHVTVIGTKAQLPASMAGIIEAEFTKAFRTGAWLEAHMQNVNATMLHGRGVFLVVARPMDALNTVAAYVPTEDFVFPIGARDIQKAPLVGVRYSISDTQFTDWAALYKWDQTAVDAIRNSITAPDRVLQMYSVYLMFKKSAAGVESFWYSSAQNKLLSLPQLYTCGMYDERGQPIPGQQYPIFPTYYIITENPDLVQRKGRAHADMHDQEALTMGWTATVNSAIRASETYCSIDEDGVSENPEITQTDFVVQPGRVLKKKVRFYSPPQPDGSILATLQALRAENASAAGQVDYAAMERKGSRKTAEELKLAQQQTDSNRAVPLTTYGAGYSAMLNYMGQILIFNIRSGYNKSFAADAPDVRQFLQQNDVVFSAAGDVDYVERADKLQRYMQLYSTFAGTPVGMEILRSILELAFPVEYPKLAPLLQDNTRAVAQQMLTILQSLPPNIIPPDQQANFAQVLQNAAQTINPQQNAESSTNPTAQAVG